MAVSMNPEARDGSLEADAQRLMTGQAWLEFCDRLKAAGEVILRKDAPASRLDRAEGYRYLTGLLTYAIRLFIGNSDPDFPFFQQFTDRLIKFGMDNSDNIYLRAPIQGDATYRITGKRGTVHYFEFLVSAGIIGLSPTRSIASLTSDKLEAEADGSFELTLSAESHAGNWLPLEPDAFEVIFRQSFNDWENEEAAEARIVQVGKEGESPLKLEPGQMARQLDQAGQQVIAQATFWAEICGRLQQEAENSFIEPLRSPEMLASQSLFSAGHFNLAHDEALIIEVQPSDAHYRGCQLGNPWWQSLDYENRQTSLNGHQAHLGSDGVYRFVVAHKDPGVPNWLDTAAHGTGWVIFRWTLAAEAATPRAQVVNFDQVWSKFPQDTPHIDEHTRRGQIALRQEHVPRRFNR